MNYFKLFNSALLAAAAVMMVSCSSEEPGNQVNPIIGGEDEGFASLAINLPSASGVTRAAVDDQGSEQEYAVLNGKVLVFQKGATEADAAFVCMSDLNGMTWGNAQGGEVTVSGSSVAKLTNINLTDNNCQYAAVVVLNYNDNFVWPLSGQTYGQWSSAAQNGNMILSADGKQYLTMTSAAKFIGAGQEPVLLADLDKAKICQTEAEAMASATAAANVYVQRNVVKVSVKTDSKFDGNVASASYPGDKVAIEAWGLDVTNKTSFPVQVTTGLKTSFPKIWDGGEKLNRFFSNSTVFQRAYWALDPNYDKAIDSQAAIEANFNVLKDVNSNPAYVYALENTFDINHQMQGQTTRAIIKASYTPAGMSAGKTFHKIGNAATLRETAALETYILESAKIALNSSDVTVKMPDAFANAGYHALSEIEITKGGSKADADGYEAVAHKLGLETAAEKSIATYANGKSFYVARVKHFGDVDTPWRIGNPTYGGDNDNYLGRYGMVRNNWYELNITSVSGPGEPIVPTIDPTSPDDENNYFIAVSVNILPWAKRVQTTDL